MKIGSLFSGIGGLELGLERALGARVAWQVEQDAHARAILAKHWPDADRSVTDVREAGPHSLAPVDLICGGFPCTDISHASNNPAGLTGPRSALWWEFFRVVQQLTPSAIVVENSGPQWRAWVPTVRRALWSIGYPTVCLRVSAASCGLPHIRDRGFIVAHANLHSKSAIALDDEVARQQEASRRGVEDYAPPMGMDDGISRRMDRLKRLGNAVAPPASEVVGRWLARHLPR